MKTAAITFMGLEAVDGFLTMWATRNGFIEVNPLMLPIAHTWVMPLQKVSVATAGIAVICILIRWCPSLVAPFKLSLILGSSFVALVLASNLIQLTGGTWLLW